MLFTFFSAGKHVEEALIVNGFLVFPETELPAGGVGIERKTEVHAIDISEPDLSASDTVPIDSQQTGTFCLGFIGMVEVFIIHNKIRIFFCKLDPCRFTGTVDFSCRSFDGALISGACFAAVVQHH